MNLHVKSRIRGAFRGWKSGAVFEFTNGQYWGQKKYKYAYKYKYRPEAKVWKEGSKYYLEVDGMTSMVEVRRRMSAPPQDD